MSTITTINEGDLITNSRAVINTNFSNLNTDKMETSVLSTDDTFANASNAKIPSQLAVKNYVDTGGNVNASTIQKGIVEEATQAELDAGTAAGATGARLFINPSLTLKRFTNGVTSYAYNTASGNQVIAHGLGVIPKKIKLTAFRVLANEDTQRSIGVYNGTTTSSLSYTILNGGTSIVNTSTSNVLEIVTSSFGSGDSQKATVTFDATNITLAWTKAGTASSTVEIYILWEAES